MIAEIGLAVGLSIVGMVVVGTVIKGMLGLRSVINFVAQTLVLYGVATLLGLSMLQTGIMVAFPLVIHLTKITLFKIVEARASRGHYGEEAQWAYELMKSDDEQFIHAQHVLPNREVREVSIIADSKDEMRDLMIERYNELVSEQLSDNADKFKL